MEKLLVVAGIPTPCVLDEIRNNTGVSVYLYDSRFIYGTLKSAYKTSSDECFHLLRNLKGWEERIVKIAFMESKDFNDFLRRIPRDMYLSLMNEGYMKPIMTALSKTSGKGLISGESTYGFARMLRIYPNVHGTVSFPFPVGNKMVHIDSGKTAANFPTVSGISHVILGYPILSEEDLAAIRQKLLVDTPRVGKTEEERKAYAQTHKPVVITAKQAMSVDIVRIYL